MFSKRKNFSDLCSRQKKRRIDMMFNSENNRHVLSDSQRPLSADLTVASSDTRSEVGDYEISDECSSVSSESVFSISDKSCNSDVDKLEDNNSDEIKFCNNNCRRKYSNDIVNVLSQWLSNEKKVHHYSVDRLLRAFREKDFIVPLSSKTLLHQSSVNITEMGNGEYFHSECWVKNLKDFISSKSTNAMSEINLFVNIDGLSLFNPLGISHHSVYPILVKVSEFPDKIFCVGIYSSNKNANRGMPHPDIFLSKFYEDLDSLVSDCITIGSKEVRVHLKAFICDAPARSALKGIVSHTGYGSCERCEVHGSYRGNSVVLLNQNATPRTDNSFHARSDETHHKSDLPNIIENHGFKMVTGFPLDVMHLCYLGVMKRILSRMFSAKIKEKAVRLTPEQKRTFDSKLVKYQNCVPSEFSRTLEGGVDSILKWKATQYRLFLLYIGIVVFRCRKIVSLRLYTNFLKFSISLRLLNIKGQESNIEFIRHLLHSFVEEAKSIYKSSFISYNVHSLLHIPDDYLNYGVLDECSAFDFENYLGCEIKNSVRAGYKPLNQIGKHVNKLNALGERKMEMEPQLKIMKCNHDDVDVAGECVKVLREKQFILKPSNATKYADSFIVTKSGEIGEIKAIHKTTCDTILSIKLYSKRNFFLKPIPSQDVDIYRLDQTSNISLINYCDILSKMMVLPYKNSLIAIPVLHSLK